MTSCIFNVTVSVFKIPNCYKIVFVLRFLVKDLFKLSKNNVNLDLKLTELKPPQCLFSIPKTTQLFYIISK